MWHIWEDGGREETGALRGSGKEEEGEGTMFDSTFKKPFPIGLTRRRLLSTSIWQDQ